MIGVIANPSERQVASEFFELFKTPWEFYRSGRRYEVLLVTGEGKYDKDAAQIILIYAGQKVTFDTQEKIETAATKNSSMLSYGGVRLPIYGNSITFRDGANILMAQEGGVPAIHLRRSSGSLVARIGYDLFAEISVLLRKGQPIANASTPTLELHIALLRDLIVANGVPLVEIPPVPDGYRFIACLTHDVDHPSIRPHKFDHTMFGFLYRAVFGSVCDFFQGRMPWKHLVANWAAALKLPFVHLGVARDFWLQFDNYIKLEKGLSSSFFLIPFKGQAGRTKGGPAPNRRGSRYGAADIADKVQKLISAGCEVGLHGIDAWLDSSSGRAELEEIGRLTKRQNLGVRMHWLYMDEQSPQRLETAGADYDSTVGYNETVGYRAGTTQAYKPLETVTLLELPLHIMDTALFFPAHLHLSPEAAKKRTTHIIDTAVQLGGSVVVNWHDRSIAPERCWGEFYVDLIEELKGSGAWFATAADAVAWFRKRRSATFGETGPESNTQITATVEGDGLPALCLRVHHAGESHQDSPIRSSAQLGERNVKYSLCREIV